MIPNTATMKDSVYILVSLRLLVVSFLLSATSRADTIWEPLTLPQSEQLRWQPLPDPPRTAGVQWKQLPLAKEEASSIVWQPLEEDNDTLVATPQKRPQSMAEAERLLDSVEPSADDYYPLLRLGPAVPTANQVDELQGAQLSFYQLAPMAGGGRCRRHRQPELCGPYRSWRQRQAASQRLLLRG